jgi:hypothetical protein
MPLHVRIFVLLIAIGFDWSAVKFLLWRKEVECDAPAMLNTSNSGWKCRICRYGLNILCIRI